MSRKELWWMGVGVAMASAGCLDAPEPEVTQEEFDALVVRLEELESREAALTELETRVAELETRDVDLAELETRIADLEANVVLLRTADWTVTVGTSADADFSDLPSALASLDRYRLASGATVTIQLESGTYALSDPLRITHPQGGQIEILGDSNDPADTILSFSNTDGLVVESGLALGRLDGVTLLLDHSGGTEIGLHVKPNAYVHLGDGADVHVTIAGWATGVYVESGAMVADGSTDDDTAALTVEDVTGIGVEVYGSGSLRAKGMKVTANAALVVQAASSAYANGSTLDGSEYSLLAHDGSYAEADEATFSTATVLAGDNAFIQAAACTLPATGTTFDATFGSMITAWGTAYLTAGSTTGEGYVYGP